MILESKGILDSVLIQTLTEMISGWGSTKAELKWAASLALHGLLDSVDELRLNDVDLS